MKKILILYAGFGAGHKSVSQNVGDILKDDYKISYMDIIEETNKVINKVVVSSDMILIKHFPYIYDYFYFKPKENYEFNKLFLKLLCNNKIYNKIKRINPDLVISTIFLGTHLMVHLKEIYNLKYKTISIITDYHIHPYLISQKNKVDKYFIPTEKLRKDLIKYGIKNEKIEVTGIPISEKFYNISKRNDIIKKYGLEKNKKTILFICGGGTGIPKNFKYFKLLLNSSIDFQYIFVSGTNNKLKEKAIKETNKNIKNGIVLGYTNDMANLMSISDLVITKAGGVVISECLHTNKKMIVISALPGQEKGNIKYLEKNKLAICIKSKENFIKVVKKCLNDNKCNYNINKYDIKKIIKDLIEN